MVSLFMLAPPRTERGSAAPTRSPPIHSHGEAGRFTTCGLRGTHSTPRADTRPALRHRTGTRSLADSLHRTDGRPGSVMGCGPAYGCKTGPAFRLRCGLHIRAARLPDGTRAVLPSHGGTQTSLSPAL